jgi:hypothetical protein
VSFRHDALRQVQWRVAHGNTTLLLAGVGCVVVALLGVGLSIGGVSAKALESGWPQIGLVAVGVVLIAASLAESPPPATIAEPAAAAMLDILATRRAFSRGDERLMHEALAYDASALEHVEDLAMSLDAGRAVVVARSFAEAVKELQNLLPDLGTIRSTALRHAVTDLITACKDYVERYGMPEEMNLPLPHIGFGQTLDAATAARFGITTEDGFEAYRWLLRYLADSCHDLMEVRERAIGVSTLIADVAPELQQRCEDVRAAITTGTEELRKYQQRFDSAAQVIADVIDEVPDFDGRRSSLLERAGDQEPEVAALLQVVERVPRQRAWHIRSPEQYTLIEVNPHPGFELRVGFADGASGTLHLPPDVWRDFFGRDMSAELFATARLDEEDNVVVFGPPRARGSADVFLPAEQCRSLLERATK